MAFIALVTASVMLILSSRRVIVGVWRALVDLPPVSVRVLAGIFICLLAITTIPTLAQIFRFSVPGVGNWLCAFVAGALTLPMFELSKWKISAS